MSSGIKKVVPACIHDAFKEYAKPDTSKTNATDTTDVYVSALLEAHKSNFVQGNGLKPPVDMSCIMKGDATCQQSMINTVGATVPSAALSALTLKDAASTTVSTSTAIETAVKALNAVVDSMCGDPTTYATIKADKNYVADPGSAFKAFKMMKPSEFASLDTSAMKKMLANAPAVGDGFKSFGDPFFARSMMETIFAGGLGKDISDDERKKRMAVPFGAGIPKDFNEAKSRGRACFNVYGATNWGGSSTDDAFKRFGPMMGDPTFQNNMIENGKGYFDNYIDGKGGLTGFTTAFNNAGSASAFFNVTPQRDLGGVCKDTFECKPPYSCGAAGKCALGTVTATFTGGPGTSCTADSACATDQGLGCDDFVKKCVFLFGQPSGGNFAPGGVALAPPTSGTGSSCTQNSQCGTRSCINGGCFDAPSGGFTGGAPLQSTCSQSSQCASNNCVGNICIVAGGAPIGGTCTTAAQCLSGSACTAGICTTSGFVALENGKPCTSPAMCSSGNCSAGVCTARTSSFTAKANGSACFSTSECSSENCTGGLCQAAGSTLKPNGAFCFTSAECGSSRCATGICAPAGDNDRPIGTACTLNSQCASGRCTNSIGVNSFCTTF